MRSSRTSKGSHELKAAHQPAHKHPPDICSIITVRGITVEAQHCRVPSNQTGERKWENRKRCVPVTYVLLTPRLTNRRWTLVGLLLHAALALPISFCMLLRPVSVCDARAAQRCVQCSIQGRVCIVVSF